MRFSIIGIWGGRPVKVTWEDGELASTAPLFATAVDERAQREKLVTVRPGGPYLQADLSDPFAAVILLRLCFDRVVEEEGDLPDFSALIALPDGSVD